MWGRVTFRYQNLPPPTLSSFVDMRLSLILLFHDQLKMVIAVRTSDLNS